MELHVQSKIGHRKKKIAHHKIMPLKEVKIEIIRSGLLSNLFRDSLRLMAHILKPNACDSTNNFDCVIHLEISQTGTMQLLVEFLDKVLKLSHQYKTTFCGVNFVDFSENKLVAQLFGIRTEGFQAQINSISKNNCKIEKDGKGGYIGYLIFNLGYDLCDE